VDVELSTALSRLRTDVRRTVAPPIAARLRERGERRLRTRRTATALVAAAVVAATLVGGGILWSGAAPKTPPVPGGSSKPTPTPSSAPSASARPSKPVQARQTPPVPANWAGVQWATATITFPAHQGCPSGPVTFRTAPFKGDDAATVGPTTWPRMTLQADRVSYGDVTGDGQAEAFVLATCWQTEEDSGDGQGELLAVRRDGTTLRALGWAGPRGGLFSDHWVAGGLLVTDVKPIYVNWGYRLGAARAYRWNGQAFTEVADSGHPGVVPGAGGTGPAVDLTRVAGLTGCPAATVRFDANGSAAGWDAMQPAGPDHLRHLVDLDGDGRRRLLVAITCGRDGTHPGRGFAAVLDPQTDGSFIAVDAVLPPAGMSLSGWTSEAGTLTLQFAPAGGGEVQEVRYSWNGEYFQP
jgi:hypothetical protein